MSNTVITNYTDLNGPSTKAESSVVVIVNKDGSLSVDQNLLGTLMGTDGTQGAISVVRIGHEGKPDDATDSESEDDKLQHVTLSVDSYYGEPNSIIKYDSGAEMLQSLRIETRENSLLGFQNDHCYTTLTSPSQEKGGLEKSKKNDSLGSFDDPVIEITQPTQVTASPKAVPSSKKITILEQQIIPKGKKILIKPTESPIILKGNDVLTKTLPVISKSKNVKPSEKTEASQSQDESPETSSISSSGESIADRDSDSDYKDSKDKSAISFKVKKSKVKPRILKCPVSKVNKTDVKIASKLKYNKNVPKKDKDKTMLLKLQPEQKGEELNFESLIPTSKIPTVSETVPVVKEISRVVVKQSPKPPKKEKKTPAHVTALLTDMSSLFSTPDVIRRISTDTKAPKESIVSETKKITGPIKVETETKTVENSKIGEELSEKVETPKSYPKLKEKVMNTTDKPIIAKPFDTIPQLDEVSLAQILQDNPPPSVAKSQQVLTTATTMSSPGLVGPLSPTLDLLGSLGAIQPEEEGLTEDLLMHVAQLVESSENLQEVIDKQVLGKVDTVAPKPVHSPFQQTHAEPNLYTQTLSKTVQKNITAQRKDPIEIVRRDGRVITLPPIEAPATRSSKRKSQMEATNVEPPIIATPVRVPSPEPQTPPVTKQYVNKKPQPKKQEPMPQTSIIDKIGAESQDSWNSEDDPNRLWCICKQPHNNRFMICCDSCEDWFHGKCVNITKAMGQQMEEQGIEWRCPNCIKKLKPTAKSSHKTPMVQKKREMEPTLTETPLAPDKRKEGSGKTICIVCKKPARASSIYCSDACILKHAQDSLVSPSNPGKVEESQPQEKQHIESRVIVYERKSGRLLAGPNAPTAENLKAWIQKNPTFEVVRPGALNTIRPNISKKKISSTESTKIQTTLNFERIPRKSIESSIQTKSPIAEIKERRPLLSPKEDLKQTPQPKTPITPKSHQGQYFDTPKAGGSGIRPTITSEKRKNSRSSLNRSQSFSEKAASVTPSTSRKKEARENKSKMNSLESIRENVRKSLQEQMSLRLAENKDSKFTEDEIEQFAVETEEELHDLFRDVGMKYKAKYRSLMFNIKDRKNLTLWEKICHKSITPKQLVRLSPEELASQELAEWRDQEAKHQLELIKKSELDLLAASKTYVLKTHKGEEVMETKESVSTELDPNVPVEDVVSVLNDAINEDGQEKEKTPDTVRKNSNRKINSRKREREDNIDHSKKSRRDSRRDSEKKSRSSRRRRSVSYEKDSRISRRSSRRSGKESRSRSISKDRSKSEKEKDLRGRTRYRSKSKDRSRRRSKSRDRSHDRSRRRSRSKSTSKRRNSENKRLSSTDEQKLRSRSQENININTKYDSADTESTERPKSAMLKEVHPEYDPHEPMITSAFSDEDLRKSRDDLYEDSYKPTETGIQNDPKPLEIEINKSSAYRKEEKASEGESDQEPSSTVDTIPVATVWNGCINMVDVARFYVSAYEVSGTAADLEDDLPTELDIVGRINPDTVWDYIGKMKKASNKDIIILRLQAANDEEKMPYIALFSYLSSRNRLGVVKVSNTTTVKDFYVVPLPANSSLPPVLMPLDGPGIGESKTHQLLTIVIRQRKKRVASHIPKEIIPAKIARESHKRSYTPPVQIKTSHSPPASPRRRNPLPLPSYNTTLSTSVKDKIAASLASGVGDEDEPYSPGSSSNGSAPPSVASSSLRSKMEELNRQIEEQKQQIRKIAQASSSGEDEAYSPSRPMTPPVASVVPLADIALPSNLHEILATIKQRSETNVADVDMRKLP